MKHFAEQLRKVPTCTAMDLLRGKEPESFVIKGVKPLLPGNVAVAGRARTLRFLPTRHDVKKSPNGNVNFDLIDSVNEGDILVFDTARGLPGSVLGDMLALRAKSAGAAAVVTDGNMRDLVGLDAVGLPVFAASTWPVPSAATLAAWESDVPIQCGGALVLPGDWILADRDAVLVMPDAIARQVVGDTDAALDEEGFCRALLERGHTLREAFPMPPALRPFYLDYQKTRTLPDAKVVRSSTKLEV